MYGYKYLIWRSVYINGAFSNNVERILKIDAENEPLAREKALKTLKPESVTDLKPGELRVGEEYIYNVIPRGEKRTKVVEYYTLEED